MSITAREALASPDPSFVRMILANNDDGMLQDLIKTYTLQVMYYTHQPSLIKYDIGGIIIEIKYLIPIHNGLGHIEIHSLRRIFDNREEVMRTSISLRGVHALRLLNRTVNIPYANYSRIQLLKTVKRFFTDNITYTVSGKYNTNTKFTSCIMLTNDDNST